MTGFARVDGTGEGMSWAWEARSVNARGLDLRLRLPDGADALEAELRKATPRRFARGNVSISLRWSRLPDAAGGGVNRVALDQALAALAEVEAVAAQQGRELAAVSAADILALRGVAEGGEAGQAWLKAAQSEIAALLDALAHARESEGAALATLLTTSIDEIARLAAEARETAAARAARAGETLRARVAALMEAAPDTDRLEQELALIAVKADVTEELDRLDAHVAAARVHLTETGPIGRKLDFLMQEFNREANTLASKSGDAELTRVALALKVVIDQMREQVQNVE
ncbi:YicC family protein [Pontivivens ytuae]|uniref:YicC family protein n=2 Tax=Pontivivens ytuae TaxID=2789856 RepID=A0A7S9LW48_9RHOB|nr:YicC family protein [Pontivivens ytuae]